MKKTMFFLVISMLITIFGCTKSDVPSEITKWTGIINVTKPGSLSSVLTTAQVDTMTNLTLTGTIDARDVEFMRDSIPMLQVLNLNAVTIQAYNGSNGTYTDPASYPANEMPVYSFYNVNTNKGKPTLITIELPNSVTSIGGQAFQGCTGLTNITIPNSVTSIGECVFQGCTGLTNVTIGNSVTSIGNYAFYSCTGLTNVIIPNSVTSIGQWAFSYCTGLSYITIGNSVTSIGECAFCECTRLTNFIIPNSVTSIGESAFCECTGLTNLTIPSSVTSIGQWAFEDCNKLTTITSLNPIPPEIVYDPNFAYDGLSDAFTTIYVPPSSVGLYQLALGWSYYHLIIEPIPT